MATTTNYGWPTPEGTAPANVPVDTKALAIAIDSTVKGVSDRVKVLETAGSWTSVTPPSGFTGTIRLRTFGPMVEIQMAISGTLAVGNTAMALPSSIPAALCPVGDAARVVAYLSGGYTAIITITTSGGMEIGQQTGASRTGIVIARCIGWSRV